MKFYLLFINFVLSFIHNKFINYFEGVLFMKMF